jgi:hypothetical protein
MGCGEGMLIIGMQAWHVRIVIGGCMHVQQTTGVRQALQRV